MNKSRSLSVLAFIFIIGGIILTLENYNIIGSISKNWPLLVMLLGAGFSVLFFSEKRKDAALIWLSSFMVCNGMFFYYLNYTSWLSLSRLWTVFLAIVGVSFLITSIATLKKVFAVISLFFIILFLALFLMFTISIKLWPMGMVMFGLSLLIIEYFQSSRRK